VSWREDHRRRVEALEAEAAKVMLDALGGILDHLANRLGATIALVAAAEEEAAWSMDDLGSIAAEWRAAVDDVVLPYFGGIFESGARAAEAQMLAVGVVVPAPDPEIVDMAAARHLAHARDRFYALGDQVWDTARAELLEGFRAGEGIGELRARVRSVTGLSRARAEALARTEVIGASNVGADARVRMMGDAAPPYKQWLSTLDGRTRPTHVRADGQVVPLTEPFVVGYTRLQVPGDPLGAPEEVINCRCTTLYLDDATPLDLDGRQEGGTREGSAELAGPVPGIVDLVAEPDLVPEAPPRGLAGDAFYEAVAAQAVPLDGATAGLFKDYKAVEYRNVNEKLRVTRGDLTAETYRANLDEDSLSLRGNLRPRQEDALARAATNVDAMDKAFASVPPIGHDAVAYRGVADVAATFGEPRAGATFTDYGYTSVTTSEDVAADFVRGGDPGRVTVLLPPSTRAMNLAASADAAASERELLLPRGGRFRITGATRGANGWDITMELLT
jgi:hypothetical protein